jgi:hypothetical protein
MHKIKKLKMFSAFIGTSTSTRKLSIYDVYVVWNQNNNTDFYFQLKPEYDDVTTISTDEFKIPIPKLFAANIDIIQDEIYNLTVLKPLNPKYLAFDFKTVQYYNLYSTKYFINLLKYNIYIENKPRLLKRPRDDTRYDAREDTVLEGGSRKSKSLSLRRRSFSRNKSTNRSKSGSPRKSGQLKLLSVKPSNDGKHKYTATFAQKNGRMKQVRFGANGMDDYTRTKNKEQRERYRKRHRKDLNTSDPTRAGYLSYYILWGESSSIQDNIRSYKRRFNV